MDEQREVTRALSVTTTPGKVRKVHINIASHLSGGEFLSTELLLSPSDALTLADALIAMATQVVAEQAEAVVTDDGATESAEAVA